MKPGRGRGACGRAHTSADAGLPPRDPARGFTLLEVLVALIIFALVFGATAQVIQTAFRQSGIAETSTTATLLARSVLERIGVDLPLQPGAIDGDLGQGLRWRVEIDAFEDQEPAERQREYELYRVRVRVGPAEGLRGPEVTLTTLRLGPSS